MNLNLKNKIVVMTDASHGIGFAIAKEFLLDEQCWNKQNAARRILRGCFHKQTANCLYYKEI